MVDLGADEWPPERWVREMHRAGCEVPIAFFDSPYDSGSGRFSLNTSGGYAAPVLHLGPRFMDWLDPRYLLRLQRRDELHEPARTIAFGAGT